MLLDHFARRYLAEAVGVSPGYAAEMLRSVRLFSDWAGDPVTTRELSTSLVAAFLRHYARQVSYTTANNKRRCLLTLWRAASCAGLAPPVQRVRRLPETSDPPEAWTVDEISRLLAACQRLRGAVACIPAADWWGSLFAVVYWTGARIGSIRQCRTLDYEPATGFLRVRGSTVKTRRGKLYELPPHAQAKLLRLYSPARELLWPWPLNPYTLWRHARRIVEAAGLPCPRAGRNLFHRLRRTNLSYCAAAGGIELARVQAGHSTAELTRRHYLDPRIAGEVQAAAVLPVPRF